MSKSLTLLGVLEFVVTCALSQTTVWREDFALPDGTTVDNTPPSQWTRDISNADLSGNNHYFEVRSGEMAARNVSGEVVWLSETIDISSYPNSIITLDVSESGNIDATDYFRAYYILDGGAPVLFGEQFDDISGGGPIIMSVSGLTGSTLQIKVAISDNASAEIFFFDNVTVQLPSTLYSRVTGNWTNVNTWSYSVGGASCNCTPGIASSVVIQNGHVVNINNSSSVLSINVQSGGILRWVSGGSTLTTGNNGSITVQSGGSIIRNGQNGAVIDIATGSTYSITVNDATTGISIQDLSISATGIAVSINGSGKIDLNQDFLITGVSNVVSSSLSPFQINNLFEINTGSGNSFTNNGAMTIGSDLLYDSDGNTFTNGGTLSITDDIRVRVSSIQNNSFVNNSSGTVNFNQLQINNSPGFVFTNFGIVNMTGQFVNGDFPANNTINNRENATWNYEGNTSDPDVKLNSQYSGSTFNYNRNGNQNIITPQSGYYNLTLSGTNTKTTSTQLTILGNLTISSALSMSNNNVNLAGNLTNSGTLTNGANTFILNGSNQSINSGSSAFNHFTVAGTNTKTLASNIDINGNLLISSTLDVSNSNYSINLFGNWTNNGSFSQRNGTVILDGNSGQNIAGSAITSFNNLTVNKSGGTASVQTNANLIGTLSLQSTTQFDADGSGAGIFTLISTASRDGRIASLPAGASVTGNLTAQRYIAQNTKHWNYIGSPVLNATVNDLQNEIKISGTFTGNNNGTGDIPSNASPSLYYYNETALGNMNKGYVVYPTTSNSEILTQAANSTQARGYTIWIREIEPGSKTFDLRGTVNQGTINYRVTYTDDPAQPASEDGWNLLGNPYPSTIDWNNAGWAKTGIQGNTIYIWDGVSYQMWNGTSGRAEQGRIAMGQGFWVQTNSASPSLISTEAVKTSTSTTYYRTSEDEPATFSLSISKGDLIDRTYFELQEEGKEDFDALDARKLPNNIITLYSLTKDNVQAGINILPSAYCNLVIPVQIENASAGEYQFSFSANGLVDGTKVVLADAYSDARYDLLTNSEISFTITDESKSYLNRFQIELTQAPLQVFQNENLLSTNLHSGIQWFKDGTPIAGGNSPEYLANESGEYFAEYITDDCELESEKIVVTITGLENETAHDIAIYPNPTSGDLNFQFNDHSKKEIRIYDLSGRIISRTSIKSDHYSGNISQLPAGVYIVRVTDNESVQSARIIKR